MSWLSEYAPDADPAAPFQAHWHRDLEPLRPLEDVTPDLFTMFFPAPDAPETTYAIVDAASVPNLPALLEASGLTHGCLFQGKSAVELGSAAPWLVALVPEAAFSRNLFTDSDAPWHLWKTEGIVLFHAALPFDGMMRHLRRFTRLRNDSDAWYYFRFWQADIMGALAMRGPFELVHQIFGAKGIARVFLPVEGHILQLRPVPDVSPQHVVPRLDAATWQAFGRAVDFRFRYGLARDCVAQGDVSEDHAEAVLTHLKDWGFTGRNTTRALALWWTTAEGAHLLHQPWAQQELAASRGMPDTVRADRLRNLAEDMQDASEVGRAHAAG